MKLLILFLLTMNFSSAAITGFTQGCPEKAQLIAQEGDKFVIVRREGKDTKLLSVSGKAFSLSAAETVTFRSDDRNFKLGDASLELEMPSMVNGNHPRLLVTYSGVQNKCRVEFNGTNHQ